MFIGHIVHSQARLNNLKVKTMSSKNVNSVFNNLAPVYWHFAIRDNIKDLAKGLPFNKTLI